MKVLQKILKFVLPLLFGVGIFWFLMNKKEVDPQKVRQVIAQGISWRWVAISLFIALLSHVVRGIRWRLQIRTLGVDPSTHDMSVSVFGNYGLNLILPRLGEVWRCNYIASSYKVPFTTTLGTMLSERIVDMLISVLIALLAFVLQRRVFFKLFDENGGVGGGIIDMLTSPYFYIIILVIVLAIWLSRKYFSDTLVYKYMNSLFQNVFKGIVSLKDLPNKWSYLFYSLLIWALYYLNTYTGLMFFDFTSHFTSVQALLIFIMGSVSLILPVQGGLGAWHSVVIFTLSCYGIGETEATAFAMVHWFIQEGFVLLLGLYALLAVALKGSERVK